MNKPKWCSHSSMLPVVLLFWLPFSSSLLANSHPDHIPIRIAAVDTCLAEDHYNPGIPGNCGQIRHFFVENTSELQGLPIFWSIFINNVAAATGTGSSFSHLVQPNLTYTVQFAVMNQGEVWATCSRNFTFKDCQSPVLYLKRGLALELLKKEATIYATDFDIRSYDNCTNHSDLLDNFRIWHPSLNDRRPRTLEAVQALPDKFVFNCFFLTTQLVVIYAFDEAGNFTMAETFVIVQDNLQSCRRRLSVTGRVQTTKQQPVAAVNIQTASQFTQTDPKGNYQLELLTDEAQTIRANKPDNPLNGVSTFDLVLITQHILGRQHLTTDYQRLAADINQSGTVSTYDVVQLQQLILGIKTTLPDKNWLFLPDTIESDSPTTPETEEQIINFTAIKIGDVDGDVMENKEGQADGRTGRATFLQIQNRWLTAGEPVTISLRGNPLVASSGYQFQLITRNGVIHNVVSSSLPAEAYFLQQQANTSLLKVSQVNIDKKTDSSTPLLSIRFHPVESGWLEDFLTLAQGKNFQSEAYFSNQKQSLRLQFSKAKKEPANFSIFPNPLRQYTRIFFTLQKTQEVHLQIVDAGGQIIFQKKKYLPAGNHTIPIRITTKGLLFYQFSTNNYSESGQLFNF